MKTLLKVSAVTIWGIIFFLTPAALAAVMGGVQALAPVSAWRRDIAGNQSDWCGRPL